MTDLIHSNDISKMVELAGQIADRIAAENVIANYVEGLRTNTKARQIGDILLFADFYDMAHGIELGERDPKTKRRILTPAQAAGLTMGAGLRAFAHSMEHGGDLSAEAWRGLSWGLVSNFRDWMAVEGYAVGSINVRLATLKRYADLARQSGVLTMEALQLIQTVKGYSRTKADALDTNRGQTRIGPKKGKTVALTSDQVRRLKAQSADTAQGRRDAVLMCLLLDQGLRCGEVALLQVGDFDLKGGVFTFDRPKVNKSQTHIMSADTQRAIRNYFNHDAPALGPLLLGSRKGGKLGGTMNERAINGRVGTLGEAIGVEGLSPHDCRHSWATRAARKGTDPFSLQEAGGWNSLAMPRRYVEDAKIANEGVKIDD